MTKKLFLILTVLFVSFSFMLVSCDEPQITPEEEPTIYTLTLTSDRDSAFVGTKVKYTATLTPASDASYTWKVDDAVQEDVTGNTFEYTVKDSDLEKGTIAISVKSSVSDKEVSNELQIKDKADYSISSMELKGPEQVIAGDKIKYEVVLLDKNNSPIEDATESATYIWKVGEDVQEATGYIFEHTPTVQGDYTISVSVKDFEGVQPVEKAIKVLEPKPEKPVELNGSVWYGYGLEAKEISLRKYRQEYSSNDNCYVWEYVGEQTFSIPEVEYISVEFDKDGNGKLYSVIATPDKNDFDPTGDTSNEPDPQWEASQSIIMKSNFQNDISVSKEDFIQSSGKLIYNGIELTQAKGVTGSGLDGTWDVKNIVVPGHLADFYTNLLDEMMVTYSKTIQDSGIKNAVTIEDVTANGKIKIDGDILTAKVDADIDANFIDGSMSLADIIPSVSLSTNIVVKDGSINIQDNIIPELPENTVKYKLSEDGSVLLVYIDLGNNQSFMVPLARSSEDLVIKTNGSGSFSGSLNSIDDIWDTYDSLANVLPSSITENPIASAYGTSGIWKIDSATDTELANALSGVDSRMLSFESSPLSIGDVHIDETQDGEISIYIDKPNEYLHYDFYNITVGEEQKNSDGSFSITVNYTQKSTSGNVEGSGSITFKTEKVFSDMKDYLKTLLGTLSEDMTDMLSLKVSGGDIVVTFPMYNESESGPGAYTKETMEVANYYVEDNTLVATVNNGLFPPDTLPNGLKFHVSIPVSDKTLVLFKGSNGQNAGIVLK